MDDPSQQSQFPVFPNKNSAEVELNEFSTVKKTAEDILDQSDQAPQSVESNHPKFPYSKIKTIMKTLPSVQLVNQEAVLLMSLAAEEFLKKFVANAQRVATSHNKKTITNEHIDNLVASLPEYFFLDGMIDDVI